MSFQSETLHRPLPFAPVATTVPSERSPTVCLSPAAGAILLSTQEVPLPVFSHVALTAATIGRVVDLGITDTNNMGAAMAPPLCYIITMDETSKKRSNYRGFQHICCRNDQLYIVLHTGVFMQKRANIKDRIYEK